MFKLPAGEYYIGDPCYVIADNTDDSIDEWHAFLDKSGMFSSTAANEAYFDYKDHKVWMHHTAYGDGEYQDQEEKEYGVDSGLIGVVPVEVTDKELLDETVKGNDGHLKTFKEEFNVFYEDGTFFIGHPEDGVMIITDPDDDDEGDWVGNVYRDLEY